MSKITDAIKKVADKGKPFKTSDVVKELNGKYSRQAVSSALRKMTEKKSFPAKDQADTLFMYYLSI